MSIKILSRLSKPYYKLLGHDFPRFIVVGGFGFIVNYIMLTLFYSIFGWPIFISQLLGAEIALLSTFMGNNFWAFKGHHHISIKRKLLKYHGSAGGGVIISTLIVSLLVKYANFHYGVALIIGAAVSLVWNYTLNKKLIFKKHPELVE